jgi:uncharacterized protein YxeA
MKKINNLMALLIIIAITMLIFDYPYKNQFSNTVHGRNEDISIEKAARSDQSREYENPGSNSFALPEPYSENEGISIKFDLGIIL